MEGIIKQYYPASEPLGLAATFYPGHDTSAAPAETAYDVLDRTVQTTLPDKTRTLVKFDFEVIAGSDLAM